MNSQAIYRGYDREGLDVQYNNRRRFPDHAAYFERWRGWSAETRQKLRHRADVAYGPSATQKLDLFPAQRPNAPIYVFIHGGYWHSLDKADFSWVAEGMAANGVATAVVNYALAPAADMDEIVRQNRAAVAWLWRHAAEFGGDPDRIFIAGHSAGGHLALMILATDWPAFDAHLPSTLASGASAISGIFDLEPIRLCYLNDTLKMTEPMAARNSPLRQDYPVKAALQVVLGGRESQEYHRQALAMTALWSGLGYPVEAMLPPELDHFSIVDDLRDPHSDLVRRQLRLFAARE